MGNLTIQVNVITFLSCFSLSFADVTSKFFIRQMLKRAKMSQILRLICGTEVSHHSWKYRHLHNKWSNFCCQHKGTVRQIMNRPYSFFVSQMKALQSTYKNYGIISLSIHPDTLRAESSVNWTVTAIISYLLYPNVYISLVMKQIKLLI